MLISRLWILVQKCSFLIGSFLYSRRNNFFYLSNNFSVIWDNDIISKIWDCFLLEGEVYAIKTGVAILKYFELDLKMETFDRAIKFLKDLPSDLDEDLLFSLIEKVNVSWQDYQDELEQQKVAEINSKVHQALLEN